MTNAPTGAAQVAGKMMGIKLTFTFNAKYEVTKSEGFEKLMDAISEEDNATNMVMSCC